MRTPAAGRLPARDGFWRRSDRDSPALGRPGSDMPAPGRFGRRPRGPAGQLGERSVDCRGGWRALRTGRRDPQRGVPTYPVGSGITAAGDRYAGPAGARLVPPHVPDVSRAIGIGDRRPRRPRGCRGLAGHQRRVGRRVGRLVCRRADRGADIHRHCRRRDDGWTERVGDGGHAGRGPLAGGGLRRCDDERGRSSFGSRADGRLHYRPGVL